MRTPSGYEHKPEPLAVDCTLPHGNEAMHDGHNEASQLWLHHQVPDEVGVPHKAFVGSLVEWKLREIGLRLRKEGKTGVR